MHQVEIIIIICSFACLCSGAVPGALEAASDQFELQLGSDRHRRGRGIHRIHVHTSIKQINFCRVIQHEYMTGLPVFPSGASQAKI